jgi:hypothetical protein
MHGVGVFTLSWMIHQSVIPCLNGTMLQQGLMEAVNRDGRIALQNASTTTYCLEYAWFLSIWMLSSLAW